MELIDLKISRRPELVSGIKLRDEGQWILIKNNPVDFVLDGYSFVNKKYLKKVLRVSEQDFDFKVLYVKYKDERFLSFESSLESYKNLMEYFLNIHKLLEIELESSDYCIIGRVVRTNEKSFVLNKLSVEGEFLGEENLKFDSVRIINCDTDYLSSLEKYLQNY
jgi:hypothetical protein